MGRRGGERNVDRYARLGRDIGGGLERKGDELDIEFLIAFRALDGLVEQVDGTDETLGGQVRYQEHFRRGIGEVVVEMSQGEGEKSRWRPRLLGVADETKAQAAAMGWQALKTGKHLAKVGGHASQVKGAADARIRRGDQRPLGVGEKRGKAVTFTQVHTGAIGPGRCWEPRDHEPGDEPWWDRHRRQLQGKDEPLSRAP